jgi:hypothetical protein
MGTVAAPEFALAAAVASPAGTVAIAYPTGYTQASFTGGNASATAYLYLNDNDRFEETADEFDISYGASTITITNKTGFTWPIGTNVLVALGKADPVEVVYPAAAVTNLLGTLTGTTTGTMANVTAATAATTDTTAASLTSTNAAITALNLQLKELQTKLNAALTSLRAAGIISP